MISAVKVRNSGKCIIIHIYCFLQVKDEEIALQEEKVKEARRRLAAAMKALLE